MVVWLCDYILTLCLYKQKISFKLSAKTKILFTYIAFILLITLFSRESGRQRSYEIVPLWSWYEVIFKNDISLLWQILLNIILFIPFGAIMSLFNKISLKTVFLSGFMLSMFIEVCQLIFNLGLFEWDDMLHNSLGCLIGGVIAQITLRKLEHTHNSDGK